MKDCLIIGPTHSPIYKDVYPLLVNKTLTVKDTCIHFSSTDPDCPKGRWFSTLQRSGVDMRRRQLTKTYTPEDYPTYDNAPDIIECSNKSNIPIDYTGKIGVPISFFFYYPELPYEILEKRGDLVLNGKQMFTRLIIRRKTE